MQEIIYDPIKQFKSFYDQHQQTTNEYFDNLVKKSKVNIQENQQIIKKNKSLTLKKDNLVNSKRKLKSLISFFVFLYIFLPIIAIIACFILRNNENSILYYCLIGFSGVSLIAILIFFHIKKMK